MWSGIDDAADGKELEITSSVRHSGIRRVVGKNPMGGATINSRVKPIAWKLPSEGICSACLLLKPIESFGRRYDQEKCIFLKGAF